LKAKFAFEQADLVCPVSEYLKKHIESYGIRARFHVVPNLVDTSLFTPIEKAFTREDNRKRLLLVALLDPKKGVPYLLKALARLKEKRDDFVLDIVGNGQNRSEYEELASKLGLKDSVHFHGRLETKDEVAEFMERCDVFVLPSLFETFGVVLIEAMACGKPVIATDIGGPNEIVIKEVGELVPPGDSESLAKTIDYMLDHYQEYDSEAIAGYARTRYSYEAVSREWNRVYKAVLKAPE
jgi:glycosyltransferase involved in cell wall biosynthesis